MTLASYRFLEDVTVDGEVAVDASHAATATPAVEGPGGLHEVTATWPLLDADPEVTGTVDGRPFRMAFPAL